MGNGVFIIAEAGSNWRMGAFARDLKMAKTLIDVASDSHADAIKFQTFSAESVYVHGAGRPGYLAKMGLTDSIEDIFADMAMPYQMIPEIADYCRSRNIEFMSSAFSIKDAEAINPYVKIHKIASYEISYSRLIEYMAKTGKPIILSTGACNYEDIEWALNHIDQYGGTKVSLLQNTAKYPTELYMLNLKVIPDLIERYRVPVGLSDHSRNPIVAPVCAVALGATIIEKHFTLDNRLPGPDHNFALTPPELKSMVQAIREAEQTLGIGTKTIQKEEMELRRFARRSIQTTKAIKKGEILMEGVNLDILRPGNKTQGLHPKFILDVNHKRATRDLDAGEGILVGDYA